MPSVAFRPRATGKSFCGALIGKALVEFTDQVVLCVCFTNHALDQFVEALIDVGVDERLVVRLGSSSKMSARVARLQLGSIARAAPPSKTRSRLLGALRDEERALKSDLDDVALTVQRLGASAALSWDDAQQYLSNVEPSSLHAFRVDRASVSASRASDAWRDWLDGRSAPDRVAADANQLWHLSLHGRHTLASQWKAQLSRQIAKQVASEARRKRRSNNG